jgi:hypothetical protein
MEGRAILAALAIGCFGLGTGAACSGFNSGALTEVAGPDYGQFAGTLPDGGVVPGVSAMLEKRCGTLDCHGQVGRPLRIYGSLGLRFVYGDASDRPGLQPTTDIEHKANYQSVIGLQPELMTEVVQGNAPPEALLLLRKPLQLERHEGGQVFVGGDVTYTCLTSWLSGQIDTTSCQGATQ